MKRFRRWRSPRPTRELKILDPKTAPLPRYSDIMEALEIKPFEENGSIISAPIVMQVGGVLQTFEKLQDELIQLHALFNRGQINEDELRSFISNVTLCKKIASQHLQDSQKEKALRKWLNACLTDTEQSSTWASNKHTLCGENRPYARRVSRSIDRKTTQREALAQTHARSILLEYGATSRLQSTFYTALRYDDDGSRRVRGQR